MGIDQRDGLVCRGVGQVAHLRIALVGKAEGPVGAASSTQASSPVERYRRLESSMLASQSSGPWAIPADPGSVAISPRFGPLRLLGHPIDRLLALVVSESASETGSRPRGFGPIPKTPF